MEDKIVVNGVDVTRLFNTINAIKETPTLATFNFRASNQWIKGGHNRSTIKEFYGAGQEDETRSRPFIFDADEPDILLGEDQGANPVEFVLHALAGCLTTSLVYHAAAQGIHLESVESTLEGELDLQGFLGLSDDIRNGYNDIRVTFNIRSDAPVEKLRELCELAQKRSPVFDIVSNPVPVTVQLAM
ncbi:MAG: OsmC family protein [Acidobacteriota bacterium]